MGSRWFVLTVAGALSAGTAFAQPAKPGPGPLPPSPTPTPTPAPAPKAGPGPLAPKPGGPGPLKPGAPAPAPATAADHAKQGQDLYNAGNYAAAVEAYKKAHELEPNNFDYRLGLAHSLRQAGNCGDAVPHYEALEKAALSEEAAADVRSNMELCPNATKKEAPPPAPMPPAPPAPAPEPVIIHEGGIGTGTTAMLVGSGLGLGAGLALFFAAQADDEDADAAASYDDHDRIATRADRLRIGAAVAAGAGVVLGAWAIYRIKYSNERSAAVTVAPRADGGAVVLSGSW